MTSDHGHASQLARELATQVKQAEDKLAMSGQKLTRDCAQRVLSQALAFIRAGGWNDFDMIRLLEPELDRINQSNPDLASFLEDLVAGRCVYDLREDGSEPAPHADLTLSTSNYRLDVELPSDIGAFLEFIAGSINWLPGELVHAMISQHRSALSVECPGIKIPRAARDPRDGGATELRRRSSHGRAQHLDD
jgi:hypothetical protein